MSIPRHPQLSARGGQLTATVYSGGVTGVVVSSGSAAPVGNGIDVLVYSGQGRLNAIIPVGNPVASGRQMLVYDAMSNVVTTSGPFFGSGHRVIGALSQWPFGPVFNSGQLGQGPAVYPDTPFFGGLAVQTLSGGPQFTVVWTPEP